MVCSEDRHFREKTYIRIERASLGLLSYKGILVFSMENGGGREVFRMSFRA